jgi:hypothetical protein
VRAAADLCNELARAFAKQVTALIEATTRMRRETEARGIH